MSLVPAKVDWTLSVLVAVALLASGGLGFPPYSPPITVHHSSSNRTTLGESGVICTRIKRRCLKGVQCVNKECQCPDGTRGNGLIECVPLEKILCTVTADPHIRSFQDARAYVDLPCRYRLTRYVTAHQSAKTKHSKCAVEVYATNELNKGYYYVASVDTSVGVTDSGQQVHHQFEVRKYGTGEDKIFKFLSNMTKTRVVWGSSNHDKINGVDVFLYYDGDNNFAVLDVPDCCTRVKYRAYDRRRHRQHLLPGLSIMAPAEDIDWVDMYGFYGHSLCGTTSDTQLLYKDRAKTLGLRNHNLAVIYDILLERASQAGNPSKDKCIRAMDAFENSQNKVEDLNECGVIITTPKIRQCLTDVVNVQPIDALTACMNYKQGQQTQDDCGFLAQAAFDCDLASYGLSIQCP